MWGFSIGSKIKWAAVAVALISVAGIALASGLFSGNNKPTQEVNAPPTSPTSSSTTSSTTSTTTTTLLSEASPSSEDVESSDSASAVAQVSSAIGRSSLRAPSASYSLSRVSVGSDSGQSNGDSYDAAVSGNGRYVAFASTASNLVVGDTNGETDIFLKDVENGTLTRVSVDSSGQQADGGSTQPSLSEDGRYVSFTSAANNLVPESSTVDTHVYLKDVTTGAVSRVNEENGDTLTQVQWAKASRVSPDGGRVLFFAYTGPMNSGDHHGFIKNMESGDVASIDNMDGGMLQTAVPPADFSATGQYVAMAESMGEIVVWDVAASNSIYSFGMGLGHSTEGTHYAPSISADGRYITFGYHGFSAQPSGYPGEKIEDIGLHDRETGKESVISVGYDGTPANNDSAFAQISGNGRYVTYYSGASNLVPGDTNGKWDTFIHDIATGSTVRLSQSDAGAGANGDSGRTSAAPAGPWAVQNVIGPQIDDQGKHVVFTSRATNMVEGDTNGKWDVFLATAR